MKHTIICPLSVPVTSRKHWILNMNNYRNAHHQTLAKAKKVYAKLLSAQIRDLPWFAKAEVYFTLYPSSKRRTDLSNVCSIHDKFAMDAIVTGGKLDDDNMTIVVGSHYRPGTIDRKNPRVELELVEVVE